jgi:hypothetical protein
MDSMPRSNRPRRPQAGRGGKWSRPEENDGGSTFERARFGIPELQHAPDGSWHVRRISPTRAGKDYTCPGCARTIPPGVEHVVAWRADDWRGDEQAAAGRRHWHTHCWKTRPYRYR